MSQSKAIVFAVTLVCFGLAFVPIPMNAQSVQADVFPLEPGLRYQYVYCSRFSYQELSYHERFVDSGMVEYSVTDSAISDDSVRSWSVTEMSFLMHHHWNTSGYDSLFWSSDTTFFVLVESLQGNHAIRCSSLVWDFPLSYPSQPVHRFADSTSVTIARAYYPPVATDGFDSLWFTSDSGFIQRHNRWWSTGHITHPSGSLDVRLLSRLPVLVEEPTHLPYVISLFQNYPNPFNPHTTVEYTLSASGDVSLRLYDLLGREVSVLSEGFQNAGRYRTSLDGSAISAGIYFYRLRQNGYSLTRKLVLLK